MYAQNPQTVSRWAQADAAPQGTAQWRAGQAGLEAWIMGEVKGATDRGELDPADRSQLTAFLSSLGVTPEKGGGRYLFNKFMGNQGPSPLAGLRRASPMAAARESIVGTYGSGTLGSLMGAPSPRRTPGMAPAGPFSGITPPWEDE